MDATADGERSLRQGFQRSTVSDYQQGGCHRGEPVARVSFVVVVLVKAGITWSVGCLWAMKGDLKGWFEVRVDGPQRRHYRLFCRLDYEAKDQSRPLLVVIDGRAKAVRTELSAADYLAVRALGDEYLARNPRAIA